MNNNFQYSNIPIYPNNTSNQYIEDILKLNIGKKVSIYQAFPNSDESKDKIFTGIIEQTGKDYIALSDPTTGNWYLLLMIYVNFIKFDEEINIVEQIYSTNP